MGTELLVDGAVVLGLAVVAPLSLGQGLRWQLAAGCAAVALVLQPSFGAAIYALPSLGEAVGALRTTPSGDRLRLLAAGWAVVATANLVCSCAGVLPPGQEEPFVRLAAVHFLFAGTGALTLAAATGSPVAVRLTALGPVVVAGGFVVGWAVLQVGGAVVLAAGVFATAAAELRECRRPGRPGPRALLAVSGLAVWAPMVLAVAWAAGQHWDVPMLSIPDMVRFHGAPNAIGFVLCGLAARRWHAPAVGAAPVRSIGVAR